MCLDCGCLQPVNSHDDSRHIVQAQLDAAAEANGNTPLESAKQILKTVKHAQGIKGVSSPTDLFVGASNRPLISFDVDNILAHKTEALLTVLNMHDGEMREFAKMRQVEERKAFPEVEDVIKEFKKNPSAYLNLVPYPDAVAAARAMAKSGFTLMISTKRKKRVKDVTQDWLQNVEFPDLADQFFGKKAKLKVCDAARARGMALVHFDDDPRNKHLMERYYPKCRVLMPIRPYTKGMKDTFEYWTDVLEMLGIGQTLMVGQDLSF